MSLINELLDATIWEFKYSATNSILVSKYILFLVAKLNYLDPSKYSLDVYRSVLITVHPTTSEAI